MGNRSPYKNQIVGTFSICLLALSHGVILSWVSPAILHLRSKSTRFQVTSEEISTFIACFLIGSLALGCILTGVLVDYIGRKMTIWLLGLPHVGFWVLVYFAQNIAYLYVARILAGFTSGGIMITTSASITEFSSKKIRANLATCFPMSINLGRLIGSIIMGYTSYDINPYIFVGVPIVFMIAFGLCPETPHQLLRRGKDAKAKESLRFYQNFKKGEENVELDNLFNEMKTNMIETGQMGRVTLRDFKSRKVILDILQATVLIFVFMSSGTIVLFNVIGTLFQQVRSDPRIGTMVFSIIQLVASIITTLTSNRYTRRKCFIISSVFVGVGFISSGVFSIFVENDDVFKVVWIFHVMFFITIFVLQFGINSLSHTVAAEYFPLKTKSISLGITYAAASLLSLATTSSAPLLLLEHGRFGVFYTLLMCACICFCGTLFYIFFLAETSKKTI